MREDFIPGDVGFDPLGLAPADEDNLDAMKTKKLNHFHLAVSTPFVLVPLLLYHNQSRIVFSSDL